MNIYLTSKATIDFAPRVSRQINISIYVVASVQLCDLHCIKRATYSRLLPTPTGQRLKSAPREDLFYVAMLRYIQLFSMRIF